MLTDAPATSDNTRNALPGGARAGARERVLALVTDAFGGYGGIAQYNRDLISALASTPAVARIDVLPRLGDAAPTEPPPGVHQHAPIHDRVMYIFAAISLALRMKPTVVFNAHLYHAPLSLVIARLTGAKLISQLHGTEIWGDISWRNRRGLEMSDLVLTVSRDTRARLLTKIDIEPERAVVLNNTFSPDFSPGDRPSARAKFGLTDERVVLTVSRLDAREGYKGHDRVFPLVAKLRSEGLNVCYLIAGSGEDRPRLEALARTLGVEKCTRFLGKVPSADLPDLYRAADLFALPSTGEGFGIAFLEALACGTPVIGLAVGGAPDALADGNLGTCVEPERFAEAFVVALCSPRPAPQELYEAVNDRFGHSVFRMSVSRAISRLADPGR